MLAANPVITEFMANNKRTLEDRYGNHPDWIEIYNPDTSPVNLSGWYLTNDKTNLTAWRFPAVTLAAKSYLVVFASGRNERVAGQELHTSFQLDADGGFVGLVKPDGATVTSQHDGYPKQVADISFGLTTQQTTWPMLVEGALAKATVPTASFSGDWTSRTYNDAAWQGGTTGVGFDATSIVQPQTLFYGQFGPGGTWNLYEVISSGTTWENANVAAMSSARQGMDGHLVTIHSAAENAFVASIASGDCWIGLTDSVVHGGTEYGNTAARPAPTEGQLPKPDERGAGWVWATGEPFTYHFNQWGSNEPSNTSGGASPANYGGLTKSSGVWRDWGPTTTLPYVIEYDLHLPQKPADPPPTVAPYRFSVTEAYGTSGLSNIAGGEALLASGGGTRFDYELPTINFLMSGGNGHFGGDRSFAGVGVLGQYDNYALQISATLKIPTTGTYTFGINSDDGFRLKIAGASFTEAYGDGGTTASGETLSFAGGRGAGDSLGVATLSAGEHRMTLTFYQGGGDAALEFFAAAGPKTSFDSSFRLVGDTANGGLGLAGITDHIGLNLEAGLYNANSTAYVRVPFFVGDATIAKQLSMQIQYDDAFVAYINGREVARSDNAPSTLSWNSQAMGEGPDSDALLWEEYDVSSALPYLVNGTNILAIHLLNVSSSDPDAFVLPTLRGATAPVLTSDSRYFLSPTPKKVNSSGTADLGPVITDVTRSLASPGDSDDVWVTAKVSRSLSAVTGAVLHYRVFNPNGEIQITVAMKDDGLSGDGAAGDGVYGGKIPASAAGPGQLVRYCVTSTDSVGRVSRWPLIPAQDPDITSNRKWPEYEGYMIPDPAVQSTMPVVYWFVVDQWAASHSRGGTRGCLVFNGEFYDNVFFRSRGGYSVGGSTKVQFNRGYYFRFDPDLPRVSEINLNAQGTLALDDSWIRPVLAFEAFRDAGVPASICQAWRVQINGQFGAMRLFVEDPDDAFFDRQGYDGDGALYKTPNGDVGMMTDASYFEKKFPEDGSWADLQAFFDGIHQSDLIARQNYLLDNFDIPAFLNYQAATVITESLDAMRKNFFLYRDTRGPDNPNGTNEWLMVPWDEDLTFGKNYGIGDYQAIDPQSHPFFGDSEHPKIDGPGMWNYLIDLALDTPVIKQMYLRRLRTVMDELLQPSSTPYEQRYMEKRLDDLYAMLTGDATFAAQAGNLAGAFADIKNLYLAKKRTHLYVNHSQNTSYPDYAGIPGSQPAHPTINFGAYEVNPASGNQAQEYIELKNPNGYAVDISGWRLDGGVDFKFPKGTVIPANGTLYVSPDPYAFRQRTTGPRGGQGLLVAGPYDRQLSLRGETVRLLDASRTPVAWFTYAGQPTANQNGLRVTEVMYNPAPDPSATYPDNNDFEFVELQNISDAPLNLNGVRFAQGIDFTFGNITLPAGGYIVVVRNRAAFESRYAAGTVTIAGEYGLSTKPNLDNQGERVQLLDAIGEVIHDFTYDNNWHWSTKGLGRSLVIQDAAGNLGNWSLSAGWRPSAFDGGSPGSADPAAHLGSPTVNIIHVQPETRPFAVDSMSMVFSEPVVNFLMSDLTLTRDGGTANLLSATQTLTTADGVTWTLTGLTSITSIAGHYVLTVRASGSSIVDLDGNPLVAGDNEGFVVDYGVPTVAITPVSPDPRLTPVNAVVFLFSKPVKGLDLGDLRLTRDGAELLLTAAQNLTTGDGVTWVLGGLTTLTTPYGEYALSLDPDGSGVTDLTQTKRLAGKAVETFTVGLTGPTVSIGAVSPDPRNAPLGAISIVFSEEVTGFGMANLSLARDGGANLLPGSATLTKGADNKTWTLGNLSGLTNADGNYTLTLDAAGVTDLRGRALMAGATESFVVDLTAPTVSIVPVTPDPRTTPVDAITIAFSEAVVGFDLSDLTLTRDGGANLLPGAAALTVGADGKTWTLSNLTALTGICGTYVLTLNSAGISDAAGNAMVSGAVESFEADITGPTVSITPVVPDPRMTAVSSMTIVFSMEVKGFTLSKLSLTRGNGSNLLGAGATLTKGADGRTWTLGNLSSLTGVEGSYLLTLNPAGVTDLVGNALTAGAVESFVVDKTAPTVSIVPVSPDPRNTPVDAITIVFSEAVVGFDMGDLSLVMGGGANRLPASATLTVGADGRTWTLGNLNDLTNADGTFTLTLNAAGITDSAGNALTAGATDTFSINVTGLSAVIVPVTPDPISRPVDAIAIVFTKEVMGFSMSSLSLVRGGGSNMLPGAATLTKGVDGKTWTLGNLAGMTGANGSYRLTLNPAGIADLEGHALSAGALETFAVDLTLPTVAISPVDPDPRTSGVSSIVIAFSEPVINFGIGNLQLQRNQGTNLLPGTATLTVGADNKTWTLGNLLAMTGPEGGYTLRLDAAGISDPAGNALVSGAVESFVVDRTGPKATIAAADPDPRNTAVDAMTILFDEPVTGFSRSNLILTRNGTVVSLTASQTLTVGADGLTWTLANLSGLTSPAGSYALTLLATGIKDSLGNAMTAGMTKSFTVDLTPPTVGIVAVSPNPRTTPVSSITISFSEAVSGFDLSRLSLTRQDAGELLPGGATLTKGADNKTWTLGNLAALTNADGAYTVSVSAAGITDLAGNALLTGAIASFSIDVAGPVAVISPVVPNPRNTPVESIVITFSETIQGGSLSNLSLTRNGAAVALAGTATLTKSMDTRTWILGNLSSLTIAEGSYTMSLSGTGITDNSGNAMASGATVEFTVDRTGPSARILPVDPDPHHGPVEYMDVVFDEVVFGFDVSDLDLSRDGVGISLTGHASASTTDQRTYRVAGLGELTGRLGSYQLRLKSSGTGIIDVLGNAMVEGASGSFVQDTIVGRGEVVRLERNVGDARLAEVVIGAEPAYSVAVAPLSQVRVLSQGQNPDDVIVDFGKGNMLPTGGLRFESTGQGRLRVLGSAEAETVAVTADRVMFAGVPIEYTGVSQMTIDAGAGGNTVGVSGVPSVAVRLRGDGQDAVAAEDAGVWLESNRELASLTVGTGGRVSLTGAVELLYTSVLTLTNGGTLDLNEADLIVQSDEANRLGVLAAVSGYIRGGRNGAGLVSGEAQVAAMTGLAVMLNDTMSPPGAIYAEFGGRSVDANSILVKYTWDGDGNLDGVVDADDYFLIDSGYVKQGGGYHGGDFNLDGVIDADDYFLIDSAFIGQTGPMGGEGRVGVFGVSRIQEGGEGVVLLVLREGKGVLE